MAETAERDDPDAAEEARHAAPDPLLSAFAEVLRRRPRAAGLSQEELAHRAGVSIRYVSLLESRCHRPGLGTLKSLADGLGLTLTELVSEIEAEPRRDHRARQAPRLSRLSRLRVR